jgi:hypothetical protein
MGDGLICLEQKTGVEGALMPLCIAVLPSFLEHGCDDESHGAFIDGLEPCWSDQPIPESPIGVDGQAHQFPLHDRGEGEEEIFFYVW